MFGELSGRGEIRFAQAAFEIELNALGGEQAQQRPGPSFEPQGRPVQVAVQLHIEGIRQV